MHIRKAYRLDQAEQFFELPLDSIIGARLAKESGGALPRWKTVRALTRDLSDEYQKMALRVARKEKVARVHLDAMWWGVADERSDRSHWALSSVNPHPQNTGFREWVALIEMVRDAWEAIREIDSSRATRIAEAWFDVPYPTFKRLALFAAGHDSLVGHASSSSG